MRFLIPIAVLLCAGSTVMCKRIGPPPTDVVSDVAKTPECPGVGDAREVPCAPLEIKLEKVSYFRRIGDDVVAKAPAGMVFGLLEFEWVPKEKTVPPEALPALELCDGRGKCFSASPEGRRAFLAMQPKGRFNEHEQALEMPVKDVAVFQFPPAAATFGLFLRTRSKDCQTRLEYCLGKRVIR